MIRTWYNGRHESARNKSLSNTKSIISKDSRTAFSKCCPYVWLVRSLMIAFTPSWRMLIMFMNTILPLIKSCKSIYEATCIVRKEAPVYNDRKQIKRLLSSVQLQEVGCQMKHELQNPIGIDQQSYQCLPHWYHRCSEPYRCSSISWRFIFYYSIELRPKSLTKHTRCIDVMWAWHVMYVSDLYWARK